MEVRNKKIRLILLLLVGILTVLGSIIVLNSAIGYFNSVPSCVDVIARNKEFALFISITGILFAFLVSIFIVVKLLSNKPVVIVDKHGFFDNTTFGALGFVEWIDVTQIKIDNVAGNKFISVSVKNINHLLQNKPWCIKKLVKANMAMGYAPISISLNAAKEKPEEVLAIMNNYWNEWKKTNEQEIK